MLAERRRRESLRVPVIAVIPDWPANHTRDPLNGMLHIEHGAEMRDLRIGRRLRKHVY